MLRHRARVALLLAAGACQLGESGGGDEVNTRPGESAALSRTLAEGDCAAIRTQAGALGAEVDARLWARLSKLGICAFLSEDPELASKLTSARAAAKDVEVRLPRQERFRVAAAGTPAGTGADEPLFPVQWGHTAVRATAAWARGARGAGVTVAVIDNGIDAAHPDIAPRLDLSRSESFVGGEPVEHVGDEFSHGTHVAGTILGADNGVGIVGVAPEATLLAVKVLSSETGEGSFAAVLAGMVHGVDAGANILNMSLGAVIPADDVYVKLFDAAATYVHERGALIVAATGNDSIDFDAKPELLPLPAGNADVLGVTATGPRGWGLNSAAALTGPASYSNSGSAIADFAAPGGNVDLELANSGQSCTVGGVTAPCWVFDMVLSSCEGGGYCYAMGTSMAAPHLSGVAALLWSEFGLGLDVHDLVSALEDRAVDLAAPGRDPFYGGGLVTTGPPAGEAAPEEAAPEELATLE
jgi:subtilisin family serine protease